MSYDMLGAFDDLLTMMDHEIYVMFYPIRCHCRLRVVFFFLRLAVYELLGRGRLPFTVAL